MRKSRLQNRFVINYILMVLISLMVAFFALLLAGFADDLISKTLMKNNHTAESLMKDQYNSIDTDLVTKNGGGIQIIDSQLHVVRSAGINTLKKKALSMAEFTEFLTKSKSKGVKYSFDIAWNEKSRFWLLVTFPTSFRIDFALVHNNEYRSADAEGVVNVMLAIGIFYLLLMALSTLIYSKLTSIGILNPLKSLVESAKRLRNGDYSARVDLTMSNEIGELQSTFNAMAQQIEQQSSFQKQSEEYRRRLVLDIAHDLKNPLASVMGYAELCAARPDMPQEELTTYLDTIRENSVRANHLINDLFELSKLDSPEYKLNVESIDVCEYLREELSNYIPMLEEKGFDYEFDIPEVEYPIRIDVQQMSRVFQNLVANAIGYNQRGTRIYVSLELVLDSIVICFRDNGIGISKDIAEDIFKPFVRGDVVRRTGITQSAGTGGTGLGLAIVQRIIEAHGGTVRVNTSEDSGCEFVITLVKI